MASEFVKTGHGNELMRCDGFSISYNPNPAGGVGVFAADRDGGDETAILAGGKFFILNGDYREDYSRLSANGLDACLSFFAANQDNVSSWSNSISDLVTSPEASAPSKKTTKVTKTTLRVRF